jgi:hypothetical protein
MADWRNWRSTLVCIVRRMYQRTYRGFRAAILTVKAGPFCDAKLVRGLELGDGMLQPGEGRRPDLWAHCVRRDNWLMIKERLDHIRQRAGGKFAKKLARLRILDRVTVSDQYQQLKCTVRTVCLCLVWLRLYQTTWAFSSVHKPVCILQRQPHQHLLHLADLFSFSSRANPLARSSTPHLEVAVESPNAVMFSLNRPAGQSVFGGGGTNMFGQSNNVRASCTFRWKAVGC